MRSPVSLLEGNPLPRWPHRGGPLGQASPPPPPCHHVPTPHLIAWLHRQELPPPEDLRWGSHRASSAQQRGGTRQSQGEQEHGIDGGRHWTGGRREAEVRDLSGRRQTGTAVMVLPLGACVTLSKGPKLSEL